MDRLPLDWEDVRLFLAVAEAGSISGAARSLGLSQPSVSRRLVELEAGLGSTLFERTLSGTVITPTAERMLEPARRMAEWAGEVARAAAATELCLRGVVRVTAPPLVAVTVLGPFAATVAKTHPGLRLEVSSAVRYLDLPRGEADLAIRSRAPTNAELVSVARIEHRQFVYVSRALGKRLGPSPSMEKVPWIVWAPPYSELPPNPQLLRLIPDLVPAFSSDDALVMLEAAEAGVGAIVLPEVLRALLRRSQLVPLSVDLGSYARGETHLVSARSALGIPRVRAVAQLLAARLGAAGDLPS